MADVSTVLRLQVRADARQAAGANTLLSRAEQVTAQPHVREAARELRDAGGSGTRVTVDAIEAHVQAKALALIDVVNQSTGSGHVSLSRREATAANTRDNVYGLTVLRAYEVASGNGLDVDALAATHVDRGLPSDAVFKTFASEAEATRYVDPDGKQVWWLVAEADGLLSKSFVSGRNDLWAQRFDIDRLTGVLTVTAEH